MGQYVLLLVVALTVGAVVFGVTVLLSGSDPGLGVAEPDGRAAPLPGNRPLAESDIGVLRFDTALRGYRMAQVDRALQRAAYDIGYKDELIGVLEAEVAALRTGRMADAEALRRAREAALVPVDAGPAAGSETEGAEGATSDGPGVSDITVADATDVGDAPKTDVPKVDVPKVGGAPKVGAAPKIGDGAKAGDAPVGQDSEAKTSVATVEDDNTAVSDGSARDKAQAGKDAPAAAGRVSEGVAATGAQPADRADQAELAGQADQADQAELGEKAKVEPR